MSVEESFVYLLHEEATQIKIGEPVIASPRRCRWTKCIDLAISAVTSEFLTNVEKRMFRSHLLKLQRAQKTGLRGYDECT